jgi:hypothetical protein
MPTRLFLLLTGALLLLRVPSLVQPMGPDQGLYAYVGERILHGELAYRDAWDQKPPGIHYVYAALRAVSSRDGAVAAADLACAAAVAFLLWRAGSRLAGPAGGSIAALIFLLLSDPNFSRYGGVRVRSQCETFIALLVSAALLLALRADDRHRSRPLFAAGLLLGATFALKYNAGIYAVAVIAAVWLTSRLRAADLLALALGGIAVPAVLLAVFAYGHALRDLYEATIAYNVRYSGETYASRLDMVRYLVLFPIQHARIDALWFVGGLGCVALLPLAVRRHALLIPVIWVGAACIAIAINGSRGLPQYFVQAAPALALAAGVGSASALRTAPRPVVWIITALVAVGVWRVNDFSKLAGNIRYDAAYMMGRMDRRSYLARYGGQRDADKYSALDNLDLGDMLRQRTTSGDTVYVFGFSQAAYVYADRRSASRFFWSRPVIVEFDAPDPRYGTRGLLADLERNRPGVVVLQKHDWAPDVEDSAAFFLGTPPLADWLHAHYREFPSVEGYSTWERTGA